MQRTATVKNETGIIEKKIIKGKNIAEIFTKAKKIFSWVIEWENVPHTDKPGAFIVGISSFAENKLVKFNN